MFENKTGSPPQVRGKPKEYTDTQDTAGITPAGAGKTVRFSTVFDPIQDHPRRCGENTKKIL